MRTAVKAEIPHIDDHVSKLQAVGIMTQNKLQDITAAAAAVGVFGITVPYNCVTKGAHPSSWPCTGVTRRKRTRLCWHHAGRMGLEWAMRTGCQE